MTGIYTLDNKLIDYTDDFAITKQVIDFVTFKIKGDVSVNFKIANTAKTRSAIGYLNEQQIGNPALNKTPVKVIRNGNQVLTGIIVIEQDDQINNQLEGYFISGNSNWFQKFNFSCKKIRNETYTLFWGNEGASRLERDNRNNIHGIVFPIVDYFGNGKRVNANFSSIKGTPQDGLDTIFSTSTPVILPCLYLHTLVEEIAKVSGVKISGNVLQDYRYISEIITPESLPIIDVQSNLEVVNFQINGNDVNRYTRMIRIESIAPDMSALEIIKYITYSFGCIPTFDVESNELSLNMTNKIDLSDSYDWSEYLKGFEYNYKELPSTINFKNKEDISDDEIKAYNDANATKFGDLSINTGKQDNREVTAYQSPFSASKTYINSNFGNNQLITYCKLYDIEPQESLTISTVSYFSASDSYIITLSAAPTKISFFNGMQFMAELLDTNGVSFGYAICSFTTALGTTIQIANTANEPSFTSGFIVVHSLTQTKSTPKVLMCKVDQQANTFMASSGISYPLSGSSSTGSIAWYSKPQGWPTFNAEPGISWSDLNISGYQDNGLDKTNLTVITKMLKSVPIRGRFLLPENVFNSYNFDRWIYLRHKNLNGYFFIPTIENYTDSNTEVWAYLYRVN